MNDTERARFLVENNSYMVLATSSRDGEPWPSPVFFAPDKRNNNFYWVSSKRAKHSRNIAQTSLIGIVIMGTVPPNDEMDGLYIKANATELFGLSSIDYAIGVLALRPQPDKFSVRSAEDVVGEADWRIYRANPTEITKRADSVDARTGQAITIRVPVSLDLN